MPQAVVTSRIKAAVSAAARRLGYTVIPTWQLDGFQGIENLRRLFQLLSIDLVIDVGANEGQFRDGLRGQAGYAGRIVSFEPVPRLARALRARAAADPLWIVEDRALGAAAGTAEFHVAEDTQFSSLLKPRADQIAVHQAKSEIRETVDVEVATLNDVLPALVARHAPRGVFLKIDTQGFDVEVLKGGAASLHLVSALQTEAAVRPLYEGAPGYREVIDLAAAGGFVISGFFANNEGSFPELIEFDCQMIRRDLVPRRQQA